MIQISPWAIIVAMGIPSAITGFCFRLIEKRIQGHYDRDREDRDARQRELDQREQNRQEYDLFIMDGLSASITLAEATAKAVQRIPDAHCNGDMSSALEMTKHATAEATAFMKRRAVESLHEDD